MIVQIRTMSRGVEWSRVAAQSAFLARRACRARCAAAATMSLLRFIGFPPGMKILEWISNPAHSFWTPLKKWVNIAGGFPEPRGSRRVMGDYKQMELPTMSVRLLFCKTGSASGINFSTLLKRPDAIFRPAQFLPHVSPLESECSLAEKRLYGLLMREFGSFFQFDYYIAI